MTKAQTTPPDESIEEEFEDDPKLRQLFKSYLRETLDEWLAEHDTEEGKDDDGRGSGTSGGNGGTDGRSPAGDARAETSESKVKRISKSIFTR